MKFYLSLILFVLSIASPFMAQAQAQTQSQGSAPEPPRSDASLPQAPVEDSDEPSVYPFGANLFTGTFQGQQQDGRNASYRVMTGDRVAVNTWGALEINNIFVVDGQGNIFLPSIGPVPLAGVKNSQLTDVVKTQISKVYRNGVGVYTNLLTAAPVGVYVTGGVLRPGRYAGVPADSVLFFLSQAGGIEPSAGSYRRIDILREGKVVETVDLYDFILSGTLPPHQFAEGDTLLVNRRGPTVLVRGEASAPAYVEFPSDSATGADALRVVPAAARATAVNVQGVSNGAGYNLTMNLAEFSKRRLSDGDTIYLRVDGRPETILVKLEGEFSGPSLLSVQRGARLLDVLNFIEVDPELADVGAVHIRRPSIARAQRQSISESLHRLERSAMLALSSTDKEAAIRAKEAELVQNFVARAKTIQPLGRLVTRARGDQQNLLLEESDTIVIPARSNVVRIGGEVLMSQAVVYSPGLTAGDYVAQAGGYTDRGDEDKLVILHSSAEVSVGDEDTAVRPGDSILVAPEVDRKIFQNASDLVQVLYQIAVAAAVVVAF